MAEVGCGAAWHLRGQERNGGFWLHEQEKRTKTIIRGHQVKPLSKVLSGEHVSGPKRRGELVSP
jgi:hypothetical protein